MDEEHNAESNQQQLSQASRRRSSIATILDDAAENLVHSVNSKAQAYERERVPNDRLKGWLSFLGLFSSRHTAGTEFAIGPLFVARGATALDVLVGLFVGNILAVLSWRFIVAPLACKNRLTAYYSMERVCGRKLVVAYDWIQVILFSGLAGAMFTVSGTAFASIFGVKAPELTDMVPSNGWFVMIVIICGLVTTIVAAVGFTFVTMFGEIMTPVLFAGIIYLCVQSLRMLGISDECGLWCTLSERVYTGNIVEGQTEFGMVHCIFFAWLVDMQLHIGMNDLSLLRFAKGPNVAWTSAGGMYIGHYVAWIVAGCMYAVQLQEDPNETSVAPGPIAKLVGGTFGEIIIIIAGWSTANPIIYSAGLALQHIIPSMRAWQSTIIVGLLATAAACFPFFTNGIIEFLGYSGILVGPMGVITFVDNFILPRFDGLKSEYSHQLREGEETCSKTNIPAMLTWISAEILSLPLAVFTPVSVYFAPVITIVWSLLAYIAITKYSVSKGWLQYGKTDESDQSLALEEDEQAMESVDV